ARALAAQSLSIFGDHSDIMATRGTGFAMLGAGSVQEVMDLSAISHLAAIRSRVPFLNFFDGFRTSHEIQKIEEFDTNELKALVDEKALAEFRQRAMNPDAPVTRGTAQNPDIYFQTREAANKFYDAVPDVVNDYMAQISKITGRTYKPFMYYGAPDAENIIIAMGSVTETIKEVIDLRLASGEKIGLLSIHLYRPFSAKYFFQAVPKSVKRICVLDRTKETGAAGDPLYMDIKEAFYDQQTRPLIIGGRYGLSSKDTTPAQIAAVYDNLAMVEPKNQFLLGIVDDVTFKSLSVGAEFAAGAEGTFEARFIGLGADGTVGANKNSIKIIGNSTDKYCQAYFSYDSKKSGGYTSSHLRFGDKPIRSTYLVNTPNFVACHVPSYVNKYDLLKGLKDGGTFLLNSIWDKEVVSNHLPDSMKKYMAEHKINFYQINATKIAAGIGLGNRTNTIMQAAFFKLSGVIPYDLAVEQMKKAIYKSYGKKGESIVNMNYQAVDAGSAVEKIEVDPAWANLVIKAKEIDASRPEFIRNIVDPINSLEGDSLPVSAFNGREDGTWDAGTSQYEKRGIAANIPAWQSENCIQCNQCAFVCPHGAIRPFLLTEAEAAAAPAGTPMVQGNGALKAYKFKIQVSPLDCTGCGNCAQVCPSPNKALVMAPLEELFAQENPRWEYMHHKVGYKSQVVDKTKTVKNLQFEQPLFEFSGACAGCGETPYIKAITQLFGDRMMVANATGCSSIYGGSAPSTPYTTNAQGKGPAWANSLFEDNAEFGLGMNVAGDKMRERLKLIMTEAMEQCSCCTVEVKAAMGEWIASMDKAAESVAATAALLPLVEKCDCKYCKEIVALKSFLPKRSQWIFGGDGWAYDIGFGGVDHVLASGENVNILIMDTEVYSNTGGQSSKATPIGAVAKFASAGKRVRKKDIGAMMMTYGYVYVAQVAMGANHNQYLQAIKEAEAYNGPSLIIAYSPCINHGIKGGMGVSQLTEKRAVECGYWHTWRFNPALEAEGKNPFTMDSKEPDWAKFQDFINNEVRYTSLIKAFPAEAKELFAASEQNAKWRYNTYIRQSKLEY
ncbi:MAG: pyruvate:ferredoxin (flavodoxin) oxidoreductase, partial [Mucinivorans sp.]